MNYKLWKKLDLYYFLKIIIKLFKKIFSIQSEFASKNKSKCIFSSTNYYNIYIVNLSNSRQEIDFIEDRFLNVKYQIEGA